jgi:hypothetical protein
MRSLTTSQPSPQAQWKALRDAFGEELHRHDSRGSTYLANARCRDCGTQDGVCHRCTECMYGDLLCVSCLITRHRYQPFHHVEVCDVSCLVWIHLTSF